MEASKRLGVALLVLAAVACFPGQSSARSHPGLDFLARVMNKESAATATCNLCLCPLIWPPKCFCTDIFDSCPSSCNNCIDITGKYQCRDFLEPDQCKPFPISSPDANRMIELPHGRE